MKDSATARGVTLLEVIIAMLILALVTSGIFGAFVFSRSVGLRSESQLGMMNVGQRILEDLRSRPRGIAVMANLPAGIYCDDVMLRNTPPIDPSTGNLAVAPPGIAPNPLNFSPELARFQTATNQGQPPVATIAGCSDGVLFIIEDNADVDADGRTGLDYRAGDNIQDLRRVRIIVKWTSSPP